MWGRTSILSCILKWGWGEATLPAASHIKPWVACTPDEAVDPFNGFLLTPAPDHLFDISFARCDGNESCVDVDRLTLAANDISVYLKSQRYSLGHVARRDNDTDQVGEEVCGARDWARQN